jgi:DNA-binding Lrp family transcriptional regulator
MNGVLKLLLEGERLSTTQMASILGETEETVEAELERLKAENILLGWRPVLNPESTERSYVRAVIEVNTRPEREGGFNRLALRVARFDQVESCYLMSGTYDLLLIVTGETLHEVASFVSERLATLEGVLSTATHFLLRSYKEQGYLLVRGEDNPDRPSVSP